MDRLGSILDGAAGAAGRQLLGYIALNRGEQINALWIVVAAVCVYLIAYRYYGPLHRQARCWRWTATA